MQHARAAVPPDTAGTCGAMDMLCLMQSPHFIAPGRNHIPTLLTSTLLYSLVAQRLVLPQEMLLMQGVPNGTSACATTSGGSAPPNLQATQYPFTEPLETIFEEKELRRLIGNAMHVSQVGSALLLIFLSVHSAALGGLD